MARADRDVRALVLAAGLGTRLRPLTDLVPKPLAPVLGVPILEATFDLLARAGVSRAAVNLHHLAAVLRVALESRSDLRSPRLHLLEEPSLLGTGGALRNALPLLEGADAVVLVNGDTLLGEDLGELIDAHLASGAAATLLVRTNPDPEAYPPVETDDDGRVFRIAGRPERAHARSLRPWLFAGVHVLDPRVLELLPPGASDVNRALHPRLLERGDPVRAHVGAGLWSDLGTPRRLLDANLAALADPPPYLVHLAEDDGHALCDEILRGRDVTVGPGARLRRSAAGHGASIGRGARIEGSLLFPGVEVGDGARVVDSILGPMAAVAPGASLEGALLVAGRAVPIAAERPA